jgi:hypothetical protein
MRDLPLLQLHRSDILVERVALKHILRAPAGRHPCTAKLQRLLQNPIVVET